MKIKNLLFLSNQSGVSMPPWNKWRTVATVPAKNTSTQWCWVRD